MRKLTTLEFIENSKKVHGDKYDYSLVEYNGTNNKVVIICKEHGCFEQRASAHMSAQGCMECRLIKRRVGLELFIEKSKIIHGGKYDYSLITEYRNSLIKVNIICKNHGEFLISPHKHLTGQGCPGCKKLGLNGFIEKSKIVHGDKYDYSLVEYVNNKEHVNIICREHGLFKQSPSTHISGNKVGSGCPVCRESSGERAISKYLELNNITFERQKKFNLCRYKNELPFDFYLTKLGICIEFNGIQHYEVIEHFGGLIKFEQRKINDRIKKEYCCDNNIPLIIIKYNENVEEVLNYYLRLIACSNSLC